MNERTTQRKTGRGWDRAIVVFEVLIGVAVVAAVVGERYGPAPTVIFILAAGLATGSLGLLMSVVFMIEQGAR